MATVNVDDVSKNMEENNKAGRVTTPILFVLLAVSIYFGWLIPFYVYAVMVYFVLAIMPISIYGIYVVGKQPPHILAKIKRPKLNIFSFLGYACIYMMWYQGTKLDSDFVLYGAYASITTIIISLGINLYLDAKGRP